jgi:hypothetical protein
MKNIEETKQLVKELFELIDRLHLKYPEVARMLRVRAVKTLYRWKNGENLPQMVYIPMIEKLIETEKNKELEKAHVSTEVIELSKPIIEVEKKRSRQYIDLKKNKEGTKLYIKAVNLIRKEREEFSKLLVELGFTIRHKKTIFLAWQNTETIRAVLKDNSREKIKRVLEEVEEFYGLSWNENKETVRINVTKNKSFREIKERILKKYGGNFNLAIDDEMENINSKDVSKNYNEERHNFLEGQLKLIEAQIEAVKSYAEKDTEYQNKLWKFRNNIIQEIGIIPGNTILLSASKMELERLKKENDSLKEKIAELQKEIDNLKGKKDKIN